MHIWLAAEAFKRLGLTPPRGVLLHGPPGCSKTLLARATATGSRATFIPLSCAQVQRQHWQQQTVAVAVAVGAQHRHCISRNLSCMLYESQPWLCTSDRHEEIFPMWETLNMQQMLATMKPEQCLLPITPTLGSVVDSFAENVSVLALRLVSCPFLSSIRGFN